MKKEDEEKLERLLEHLKFDELSFSDREFVINMLGSEEEYIALQKIESALMSNDLKSDLLPEPSVLASIKERLRSQISSKAAWYDFLFKKTPAYVTLLLMIFSFGIAAMLLPNPVPSEEVELSTIFKNDTIYMTRTDTVFSERVVYRQARNVSPSFKEVQTAKALENTPSVATGVSMKDKEELNKLLVSGSD